MARETLSIKGGEKAQQALADLVKRITNGRELKVGFFPEATYEAELGAEHLPIAQVAFWNEFGTSHAPPRPFFRQAIAKNSPRWGELLGKILEMNDFDGTASLKAFGDQLVGQVQRSINEFTSPALADYTVKKKGFPKPLIHTGQMLRAVNYKVGDES